MNTQSKLSTLVFMLALTLFTSCGQIPSDQVEQSSIRTKYRAKYIEADKKLLIHGTFTTGFLTFVSLDSDSSLRVNGYGTKEKRILLVGTPYYEYKKTDYDRSRLEDYDLVYTNKDGEEFRNTVRVPSRVTSQLPDTVRSNQDIIIDYDVEGSMGNSSYVTYEVMYSVRDQSQDPSDDVDLDDNSSLKPIRYTRNGSFRISAEEINEANAYEVNISVCHESNGELQEHPGAGGGLSSSYCTGFKTITIED